MKKILLICIVFVCIIKVAAQTILPDETAVIDTETRKQCQQIVDKINTMPLKCDTAYFESRSSSGDTLFTRDEALFYNLTELYFDKNQRLRKYFHEGFVRDGENSHLTMNAWYDEKGNLIYISYDGDSHCDAIGGYFYIHTGQIVDFKTERDCGCCDDDEELTKEEIDNMRPVIGSSASEATIGWHESLANYIHAETLLSALNSDKDND
ncbi:MAG: hypothetical protein LBV72_17305 [Tannerella sp.]|jgi:hypothetical protein|nr:hypothetical protein [Tannerella sp.]